MPAIIRTLQDNAGNNVFPETIVSAVNMPDGKRTLLAELDELEDESSTTTFNADGSITKVMTNSGMIITTAFSGSVVTETCTYSDLTPYYTKTTTFNADGTITVDKQYASNGG
jgi:hypothetical protein